MLKLREISRHCRRLGTSADYSGDSDLSMPSMDTEHTPVETPIKTPVQVPNISQRLTPIKAPPAIAVVTTRSGRVIRPAKKLSL